MDCSCAPIFQFFSVASDGDTTERQIYIRVFFGQFRTSFRNDSVVNYESIWTLFSKFITLLRSDTTSCRYALSLMGRCFCF